MYCSNEKNKNKNTKNHFTYNKLLYLLNLDEFKIKKCNNKEKHNNLKCVFYHNIKDRRRNLKHHNYDIVLCKNFKNKCNKKDNCSNSHNKIEIIYHPNIYKKKICENFWKKKYCKYDKFCSFAHSLEELQIRLIHKFKQNFNFFLLYFKTEFCPWGNIVHDKNSCIYSHNLQDFKRNNLFFVYPKNCKYWDKKKIYQYYKEGCKNGLECKYTHGWKEFIYHPLNYRQIYCENYNTKCKEKLLCHKIHQNDKMIYNNKSYKNFLLPYNNRTY